MISPSQHKRESSRQKLKSRIFHRDHDFFYTEGERILKVWNKIWIFDVQFVLV